MITITGTVGASGKYLVTGMPIQASVNTLLKITFENNTSGTNLELYAGSDADFNSGSGGIRLNGSGGPGYRFLTIIDSTKLSGKILFVRRGVGTAASKFTINIE